MQNKYIALQICHVNKTAKLIKLTDTAQEAYTALQDELNDIHGQGIEKLKPFDGFDDNDSWSDVKLRYNDMTYQILMIN